MLSCDESDFDIALPFILPAQSVRPHMTNFTFRFPSRGFRLSPHGPETWAPDAENAEELFFDEEALPCLRQADQGDIERRSFQRLRQAPLPRLRKLRSTEVSLRQALDRRAVATPVEAAPVEPDHNRDESHICLRSAPAYAKLPDLR